MRDPAGGAQPYEYAVHRTVGTERLRWLALFQQYLSFYGLLCSGGDQVIAGTDCELGAQDGLSNCPIMFCRQS
jgi:hypothetical protein